MSEPNVNEVLEDELKQLRRGRGVREVGLPEKVGEGLRRAFGVLDSDDAAVVRRKVVHALSDTIDRLPPHWQRVARVVFGFDNPDNVAYLDRLAGLGLAVDREVRTVQRRANDVVRLIAEMAATGGDRWRTTAVRAELFVTGSSAKVVEQRDVVSEVAGLTEVGHALSLPNGELPVITGDEVFDIDHPSARKVTFVLRPSHPLGIGEVHTFTFAMELSDISPLYCCTPEQDCDRFELTAAFDPPPPRLWAIRGELTTDAEDPTVRRDPLDPRGEVKISFDRLRPARSYGIGWLPG